MYDSRLGSWGGGGGGGIPHIIPVATKEECMSYREKGYLLAGERNGKKIEGYDLGNSPFDFKKASSLKRPVCMTTTNGTKAIELSNGAKEIVIGSLLNLEAVTEHIKEKKDDVLIFCAGWKGKYSLEDSLFAGALVNNINSSNNTICDASYAAQKMYLSIEPNIHEFLLNSAHAKRLSGLEGEDKNDNIAKDIKFCCSVNKFNIVPILKKDKLVLLG